MLRTIVCLVAFMAISAGPLAAQDRIAQFQKKLEKGWDEIKPRGKLLQQVRESFKSDDSKVGRGKTSSPAAGGQPARSPTLALPPVVQPNAPSAASRPATSGLGWPRTAQRDESNRAKSNKAAAKPRNERAERNERPNVAKERNSRTERERRGQSDPRSNADAPRDLAESNSDSAVNLGVVVDGKRKSADGVRVAKVEGDSPADRAGLRAGDVLVKVAGVPVSELQSLDELLNAFGPNDQIQIEYLRGKKPAQTMVSFGAGSLPTAESLGAAPAAPFDDASVAPLPPGFPAPPADESNTEESPGLISVLAEPRQTAPSPAKRPVQPLAQPNPYFPSPQVLPPVTGSAVGNRPGGSIVQPPAARKLDPRTPDRSMFQPLPPRIPATTPPVQLQPSTKTPAADAEMPEIELLSPDGN